MNKLPWFKHDGQASNDDWLRMAVRKAGPVAGWVFWGLCEQLHTHGRGNILSRDVADIAHYSLVTPRKLLRVLSILSDKIDGESKLVWRISGKVLTIEIKNFRKKQEKSGGKNPSKPPENPPKTPLDKKKIKMKSKNNTTTTPRQAREAPAGPYEIRTDEQRLMCAYKIKKGVAVEDREWDRANYKTWARAASKLLRAFRVVRGNPASPCDVNAAIDYLGAKADEFSGKGLDWNLATIAKHAWDRPAEGGN